MPKAIFFDLDGTLVDTEGLAIEVTRTWLESRGYAPTPEMAQSIVGRTWTLASRILHERLALTIPPEALERELIAAFRERTAEGLVTLPGAADFIRALAGRTRMFVVSGSPRRDIEHALQLLGVKEHFESWFGAEDYPRSKPAPDSYLKALEASGLRREEVLIFEDSEAGIAAAEAAGIAVVVVTGAQSFPPRNAHGKTQIRDFTGADARALVGL